MNPQIRFGEDLMSRVSYVMMNPGGDEELTSAVRRALDELLGELVDAAGVDARARARGRDRRQPDHAPPRARHRPDATRAGAVRARDRRRGRRAGRRARARPAVGRVLRRPVHRRPRRRRHGAACSPRARTAASRCSCSSTSAPTPRSSSATATPVRRVEPDRTGLRGRPDQQRAAGDGRGDRAGAHRSAVTLEPRFR